MNDAHELRLPELLLTRRDSPPCTTLADWLPIWRRSQQRAGGQGPFAAAVHAALQADRVAWAFFSGYQGALQAAFPTRMSGTEAPVASLCANESGVPLNRVETRLEARDGGLVLNGRKSWMLDGGADGRLFVLARSAGGPDGGPGSLCIVELPRDAAGVQVSGPNPQAVVPELPHARLAFDGVIVDPAQVVPGDGYADHAKPFRLREDVFVTGCTLAHLLSHAHRSRWPSPWRQRCVATLLALERCATLPPGDTATVLAAAGALAWAGELMQQLDELWTESDAEARQRWDRDRPLLAGGREARRQRATKAWDRVDAVGDPGP